MADAGNIIAGAIPGIIGLGASLGSQIPKLKKPKRVDTSKRAVSTAANRMASAAMGAAAGRGGQAAYASREAARTGAAAAESAAGAYSEAAARDEATYQNMQAQRREAIAGLGQDIAAFAAETGVGIVDARQAAQAEKYGKALAAEGGKFGVQDTGYAGPGETAPWNVRAGEAAAPGGVVSETPGEAQGVLPNQPAPQQLQQQPGVVSQPPGGGELPAQTGYEPISFHDTSREILRQATNAPRRPSLYNISYQDEQRLRLENLVWDEVQRTGTNPDLVRARIARYMAKMPQFQFADLTGDTQVL